MTVGEIWRRVTTTPYAHALEAEVARQGAEIRRLRAENRALLNSILGIAGIPPVIVDDDAVVAEAGKVFDSSVGARPASSRRGEHAVPLPNGTGVSSRGEGGPVARQVAAPLRRRSWPQISRMFEFEAARKAVSSDS